MQQYRVNYSLLIGLIVGTVVVSVASYGLWLFQINRNAGALITSAKQAEEKGDIRQAAAAYQNYLSIRSSDDDVRVKLGNMWVDITELQDVKPEEMSRAIYSLEQMVRDMPDQKDLQRRLVDLYGRVGGVQQAVDHLRLMVQKYPNDPELQVKQLEYLVRLKKFDGADGAIALAQRLIGYDPKSDTFDTSKAIAPTETSVYGTLASLLRGIQEDEDLADRVMEQLIKENSEKASAYLQRGQYLIAIGEPSRGQRDLQKAYQIAPEDADVLLAMAGRAQMNENIDQAREFLNKGLEKYPDDARFYQGLASLYIKDKKYEEALAVLDDGLKNVSRDATLNLLFFKSELQFLNNDVDGARRTADEMRRVGFIPAFVEWVEARILLAEGKWYEGMRALRGIDQQFINSRGLADDVNNQLGLCYEKLGQLDNAIQRYQVVLQRNPNNEHAKTGEKRVKLMLGRKDVASGQDAALDAEMTAMLAKPKAERNWTSINAKLTKMAEAQELEGAMLDLFWARIEMMREDWAAARKYLVAASNKDKNNLQVKRTAIQLLRLEPGQGPEKSLRLLDQVVSSPQFGDQPVLRLDRADLYLAMHEKNPDQEKIAAEFKKIADAPADWTNSKKIDLWNGMAQRYLALKMQPEATALLERVAGLQPDQLPTLVALFALALEANDDAGMIAAQDKIFDVVGSKNDSTWLFTEARRKISQVRRGQLDQDALPEIRSITERAIRQRPDWFELQLVAAELEMLAGNQQAALEHFNKASELGRPNSTALLQHVRLLLSQGQIAKARTLIEQLPKEVREGDLGQLYAEVLFSLGQMDEAVAIGDKFLAAAPDNPERHLRYGQLLSRIAIQPSTPGTRRKELLEKAGKSLNRSAELAPENAETWLALITFHVVQKNAEAAQLAVQQMQLSLPEDQLIGVLAKAYEILGGRSWFDAETLYLTLYNANPDNLRLAQQLAMFYLSPGYPVSDKHIKATPLVNKVLRGGADGKLDPNDPALRWARRAAAELLAATRDYQQILKAEKLLASNAQDGRVAADDRLLMARILASRPEPDSRHKATIMLEQIREDQRLSLQDSLALGQLYFALGDAYWEKCRSHMLQTVSDFEAAPEPRGTFIDMLIRRGSQQDYALANTQLDKFRELAPGDVRSVQYTVRLASKTGKKDQARNYLLSLVPKVDDPSKLTEEQVAIMEFVGGMLTTIEEYADAEKVYRTVVSRDSNKSVALAEFLGQHGNVDESFTILEGMYKPEVAEPIARVAVGTVRARRDEIDDKYDAQIQQWLDRALLENPDSIPLLMLQAEFDDVRTEYDNAADIYQNLLARKDLTGVTRAIVLNNMAFLVALAGSEAETGVDPLKLVQEAAQILGPTADILDTRAVVYNSLGDYQKAIRDLEYSVTDNPTPSKYFHKAVAHLGAGENKAAVESWVKAEELGDIRANLNRMEYPQFDQVKTKIDNLRSQNAKLTDADKLRAAG